MSVVHRAPIYTHTDRCIILHNYTKLIFEENFPKFLLIFNVEMVWGAWAHKIKVYKLIIGLQKLLTSICRYTFNDKKHCLSLRILR